MALFLKIVKRLQELVKSIIICHCIVIELFIYSYNNFKKNIAKNVNTLSDLLSDVFSANCDYALRIKYYIYVAYRSCNDKFSCTNFRRKNMNF